MQIGQEPRRTGTPGVCVRRFPGSHRGTRRRRSSATAEDPNQHTSNRYGHLPTPCLRSPTCPDTAVPLGVWWFACFLPILPHDVHGMGAHGHTSPWLGLHRSGVAPLPLAPKNAPAVVDSLHLARACPNDHDARQTDTDPRQSTTCYRAGCGPTRSFF